MRAFCLECKGMCEPGFHTTVTPTSYECDEEGDIVELDTENLRNDWVDGMIFAGWWCPECHEWYNKVIYREVDDTVFASDSEEEDDDYRCMACGGFTANVYCERCLDDRL